MLPSLSHLFLALAATSLAAPTATSTTSAPTVTPSVIPPPVEQDFAILANVTIGKSTQLYNFLALQPSSGKASNTILLMGQPCAPWCPATNPYFWNGDPSTASAALDVDLSHFDDVKTKGPYGLVVPQVGSGYGQVETVTGVLNYQKDAGWGYTGGAERGIYHKQTGAGNRFWMCNAVIDGKSREVLKWGNAYANGTAPGGCNALRLYVAPP